MSNTLHYDNLVSDEDWSPAVFDERQKKSGWEWYLVFCFTLILLEAFFNADIGRMLEAREYWFTRIVFWKALPTDLYFLGAGFIIGLAILAGGSGSGRAPSKGVLGFVLLWVLYGVAAAYGGYVGNPEWHRDFRNVILPSVVVPWAIVLAHQVRMDVVMSRIIKISLLLAFANMVRGLLFFARGGTAADEPFSSGSWQADFGLLLVYLLAFSRSISGNKGSKLSVVILAVGVLAPLHKQTLAIFLVANVFLLFMVVYNGRGNVNLSRTLLTVILLVVFGTIFGTVLLSLGGGAARDFLYERILKGGRQEELMSGTGRSEIWKEALVRWTKKPVLGEGLGAAHLVSTYERGIWWVPTHNYALQMLMQTGIIGFLLIFVVMMSWMVRAVKTLKYEVDPHLFWVRMALTSYIVALLITCLFGYYLAARCVAYTFWLLIGFETYAHSRFYSQVEYGVPYGQHEDVPFVVGG